MRLLPSAELIVLLGVSCMGNPAVATDRTTDARSFLELLSTGELAKATASFDATMSNALPEAKLRTVWDGLVKQVGAFKRQGESRTEKTGQFDVVFIACEFERAQLDAKIVYNDKGRIAGLFFVPSTPSAAASVPPYVSQDAFEDRDLTFGAEPWVLRGSLSVPKGGGPFPCIVLVHGSGPQDRDETVGANKPFRDIAWGLATRGIAAFRYEKRTLQHASKLQPLPLPFTVNEETIDDVIAAVGSVRTMPEIDPARIFILGHSLGGMLIPRIAARVPEAAGFIVLAGATRPLEDVIIEQTNYLALLDGDKSAGEQRQIEAIQAEVNRIKTLTESDASDPALVFGAPASYWLDLRGYDPAASAKSIEKPLLLLQGERDYQVTMTDFQRWKSAMASRPNATLKSYPGLNHLFERGDGISSPDEYLVPRHVAPEVIEDLASWLTR